MTLLANILIDGIAYGMVLFIIAVGLSVTLGLMRFVNLAHGAFAMTGGYIAAWLVREQGLSFYVGVPLAVLATGLLGALLEVTVLRPLYRRTELQQVLFTIGLTFLFVATANLLAGPEVQLIPLPPTLSHAVDLGIRTLPAQRLLVIASGVLVVLAAFWVLRTTRLPPRPWAFRCSWFMWPPSRWVRPWLGWVAFWARNSCRWSPTTR